MKVCFYSPYIPKHFGGGEKHLFDIASLVATRHHVNIALPRITPISKEEEQKIRKNYEEFLNYSLEKVSFVPSPLLTGSIAAKLKWTKQFDHLYYATDGSLFLSAAKKNNLHIQIPFTVSKSSPLERIKLKNWHIKNTNSKFTKDVVEKNWKTTIDLVHNPLVNLDEIKPGTKKEKIILNVGRFFKQLHSKRQDVLVDIFKELIKKHPKVMTGWKLVLIGNVEDKLYFESIKKAAKGLPIEFYNNASRIELISFYQKASIYWHATGFEIDQLIEPSKVEHFGITTIEAMAAGDIPVVVGSGGQVEILGTDLSELLWQTKAQCVEKTLKIINNELDQKELRQKVINRVKNFSSEVFEEKVWQMFK